MGISALRQFSKDLAIAHLRNAHRGADVDPSSAKRNLIHSAVRQSLPFADVLSLATVPIEKAVIQRTHPKFGLRPSQGGYINVISRGVELL